MTGKKITIEDLSLRIAGLEAPFTLIGREIEFKPDDWAWQFLRLSGAYKSAYDRAVAEYGKAGVSVDGEWLGQHVQRLPAALVSYNRQYCREVYVLTVSSFRRNLASTELAA